MASRRPPPPWRGFRRSSDRRPRPRRSSVPASRNWHSELSYDMMIDRHKVKRMSAIVTVSSKFQISIPKEVRDQLGLRPGQKVAFIAKPEGFLIVPVPKREDLAGRARGAHNEGHRDRNDRY